MGLLSKKDKKWLSVVRAVAPTIATALGGPLAGTAVSVLGTKLFGEGTASTEDDIATAVASADPEVLVKLKQAEAEFKTKMEELEVERDTLFLGDRDSARKREMAVKDRAPVILAVVAIASFLGYALLITLVPIAATVPTEVVYMILGALSGYSANAFAYYHGSSRGSKDKTDAMTSLLLQMKK